MTHILSPKIEGRERNIIMGTILGGSSIVRPTKGRNCYLSMRSKDLNWLRWKATELEQFASCDPITVEKTNRWHSICYPVFNEFRDLFYTESNDRKLDGSTLDLLQDLALAVWFADCGKYVDGKVMLNTHIWKEEGSHKVVEYFKCLDWNSEVCTERKNFRVRISEQSSKDFLKITMPHLPHFFIEQATPFRNANQEQ